jgi:hypothetical protein
MKNDADQCEQQIPKKKPINKSPAGQITVSSKTVSTDSEFDYIQQIGFILDFFLRNLKKTHFIDFFCSPKSFLTKFFYRESIGRSEEDF